jgi:hypothetical protein
MSNARNLANLLNGGDTTIATGDVANGAISTAKLADDAVTAAKIDDDGTGFAMGDLTVATLNASTAILPDASGGADIGSTSKEFGDIYIADDKAIKFGSNQDVTMEYDEDGTDTLLITGDATFADDKKLHFGTGKDASIEYDEDGDDQLKIGGAVTAFTNAVIGKTNTAGSQGGSTVLDFDANQNFVLTLTSSITLANPSTEKVGQSGFIVFIQDGTGSRTCTLGTDYESAASAGITLTTTANATDIVPYVVAAANRILLGTPQLAFG